MYFRGNDPEWCGCMIQPTSGGWVLPASEMTLYLGRPRSHHVLLDKSGTYIDKCNYDSFVFIMILMFTLLDHLSWGNICELYIYKSHV